MPTTTQGAPAPSPSYRRESDLPATRPGPILVGAGGEGNRAVLRAAELVAHALGRELTLVTAVEASTEEVSLGPSHLALREEVSGARRWRMEQELSALGAGQEWSVIVAHGTAPQVLAQVARTSHAAMLVMGLGHRGAMERLLGGETSVRTARQVDCPVLAVPPTFERLPRTVVAGVDFSDASRAAIRRATPMLGAGATVHLVHVWTPLDRSDAASRQHDERRRAELEGRCKAFADALELPSGMTVQWELAEGRAAHRLLDAAEAHRAELLVVGRHGQGIAERLLVGSVATRVMRGAHCAVFIVPEPAAGVRMPEVGQDGERTIFPRADWEDELNSFSRRNAGRLTLLQTADVDGAPWSREHGFPFFGVRYLPVDDAVEIILGEAHGRRRHLTRSIPGASSVTLFREGSGADRALVVRHGHGETVLEMLPSTEAGLPR